MAWGVRVSKQIAGSMLGWLGEMTHPDGQIALFNDAAMGIAPNLAMLQRYAERVGLTVPFPLRADGVRPMTRLGIHSRQSRPGVGHPGRRQSRSGSCPRSRPRRYTDLRMVPRGSARGG